MYRVGWFSTANGKTSQLLLSSVVDAISEGSLDMEMAFVFVSREMGESDQTDTFINMVKGYDLPLITLSFDVFRKQYASLKRSEVRELYDQEVIKRLKDFDCDLVVLAGYMLIVSEEMCSTYPMINLHPSLPNGPKGTWREVIWQLIEEKAVLNGCMMHLVTPELDRGPVMTYCQYPIRGRNFDDLWKQRENQSKDPEKNEQKESDPLFQKIRAEGVKREIPLILHTLQALAQGEIQIQKHRLLNRDGYPINGLDITTTVEKSLMR